MLELIFIAIGIVLVAVGLWLFGRGKKEARDAEAAATARAAASSGSRFSSYSSDSSDPSEAGFVKRITGLVLAGVGAIIAIIYLFLGFVVQAGQGEAKIVLNIDQSVDRVVEGPAWQLKGAWQSTRDFDLFSQELLYAGGDDGPPSYSGGTVSGKEVTVSVGGLNGGSTRANVDISVTYSLDAEKVKDIFRQYKTQERFTEQIVAKTVLATIRQVPGDYTAQEFRGQKQVEASERIMETVNKKLEDSGVTVNFVNIQRIQYSDAVEQALTDIETAANAVQKAEEEQRRVEVEAETARIQAEGEANAAIARAEGEAQANRLIAESLTPEVLAKLQIDAYDEGTIFTIPEGATPFVSTGK